MIPKIQLFIGREFDMCASNEELLSYVFTNMGRWQQRAVVVVSL